MVKSPTLPRKRDPQPPKRILLVDDHPVLRKGLARLIDSKREFAICGEAGEANEALNLIRKSRPDLVIADIGLPGINGIDLTKMIRREFPKLAVLILSMHEEPLYAVRALRAGAGGYIVKQDALENISTAVRNVLRGQRYISPVIANQLITKPGVRPEMQNNDDPMAVLSDRELEIFELIGKGHEVRGIADALGLSPKTVETHRTHIKTKLKVKNAQQVRRFAVQWAIEHAI
jgi:DNA-binding NarL/FixJ family response regulator